MINIGIIGCGHWGPNHIRVFLSLRNSRVLAAADSDNVRLQYITEEYPNISIHEDYRTLLSNPDINAVVVSTPTQTHYEIVRTALQEGKHVLCEKPLCQHVGEGEKLVGLANEKNKILMVGHIFLFNAGIVKLKELLQSGELGRVFYLSATRTNLGPIRNDVNVVYDLATHDISICDFLFDTIPVEVSAVGVPFLQDSLQDVAFITLKYPDNIVASIRVSWIDPRKIRQITVVGDKKMATWDDLAGMGPVVIYDKGVTSDSYYQSFGEFQLLAREGDITIPKVKLQEPLKTQNNYFLSCVEQGQISMSDGRVGVNIVKVLTAINQSMISGGQPIVIK